MFPAIRFCFISEACSGCLYVTRDPSLSWIGVGSAMLRPISYPARAGPGGASNQLFGAFFINDPLRPVVLGVDDITPWLHIGKGELACGIVAMILRNACIDAAIAATVRTSAQRTSLLPPCYMSRSIHARV